MSKRAREQEELQNNRPLVRPRPDPEQELEEQRPPELAYLVDTSIHAFHFIDAAGPFGVNFERPHTRREHVDKTEAFLEDYYARQGRIILELLSRTNKAQEDIVRRMLADMYAESLDDFSKQYGFDERPDFGELLLYYVHQNRLDEVTAMFASAYNKYGLVRLKGDDDKVEKESLFNKRAVKGFFRPNDDGINHPLQAAFRLAGHNGAVTMFRKLRRLYQDYDTFQAVYEYGHVELVWQGFHFIIGALEYGHIDAATRVQKHFMEEITGSNIDKNALQMAALRGLARGAATLQQYANAGYLPLTFSNLRVFGQSDLPLPAHSVYLLERDARHPEQIFASWISQEVPARDKFAEMAKHPVVWLNAVRALVNSPSAPNDIMHTLSAWNSLEADLLPEWLRLLDSIYAQPNVGQTTQLAPMLQWAAYSGCLHALGKHGFAFTWEQVVEATPALHSGDMEYIGMRYFGPFTWTQLAAEATYYRTQGLERPHFVLGMHQVLVNGTTLRGVSPTLQQWRALKDLLIHPDDDAEGSIDGNKQARAIAASMNASTPMAVAMDVLAYLESFGDDGYDDDDNDDDDVDAKLYGNVVDLRAILHAWTGMYEASHGHAEYLQRLGAHIEKQTSPAVVSALHRGAVNLFTYHYPRKLLLFLLTLRLEHEGGEEDVDNDEALFQEWANDAQSQLDDNFGKDEQYGPRERHSVRFFDALLAREQKKQGQVMDVEK